MLYYEFLEGTGAPDNKVSYIIYHVLERVYMEHEDFTKREIYKYGQMILDDLYKVINAYQISVNTEGWADLSKIRKMSIRRLYEAKCRENDINRQEPDKRKVVEDNEK